MIDADERARQVETMLAHPRYRDDKATRERIEAALRKAGYLDPGALAGAVYQPPTEIPDDALLSAEQLAAELTARGFRISAKTLDTKVSRPGATGSPPYEKWGPWRRYRFGPSLAWAQTCLS